jgi:hypothetical protein
MTGIARQAFDKACNSKGVASQLGMNLFEESQ